MHDSGSLWTSGQTRLGLVAVSSQERLGYAGALAAGVLRFLLFLYSFRRFISLHEEGKEHLRCEYDRAAADGLRSLLDNDGQVHASMNGTVEFEGTSGRKRADSG